MNCPMYQAGFVELYFYDELPRAERAEMDRHLRACAACRDTLRDLTLMRAALAARPDVAAPPAGEWSGFMAGLEAAIRAERSGQQATAPRPRMPARPSTAATAFLAIAAALTLLVAASVGWLRVADRRDGRAAGAAPAALPAASTEADPALVSLSGAHFERSKLVVLGLATREADAAADWEYERALAADLLDDTRLYRLAAEERGMAGLAGVMRELELVLLQTSMAEGRDTESLAQIQRLIRRRDLVTKMDIGYTTAGGR